MNQDFFFFNQNILLLFFQRLMEISWHSLADDMFWLWMNLMACYEQPEQTVSSEEHPDDQVLRSQYQVLETHTLSEVNIYKHALQL